MKWLVLFHVIGATIWVGGHLILTLAFLPKAMKEKNVQIVIDFEKQYERVGLPALALQIITGFWLVLMYVPLTDWFSLSTSYHFYLWLKIALLLGTIALAMYARIFILPRITIERLPSLAIHIILATLFAVCFLLTGLSFRFNYFLTL